MGAAETTDMPDQAPVSTILIVEDEVLIRLVLADFLRGCGFRVVEAASATEAIAVLESGQAVELVLSDIEMPGEMDGFGLAQWVRTHRAGLPIVLTSGIARKVNEAGKVCKEEGSFLPKPYDLGDVERTIRRLLASQKAG